MSLPSLRILLEVQAATVRFLGGGQGVLVPGHLIVTAAHNVTWTNDWRMAANLPNLDIESIETRRKKVLKARIQAVEPVADIAVLGSVQLDECESEECHWAFEAFCDDTTPVTIARVTLHYQEPVPVHVLAHTGRWISARARLLGVNAQTLAIEDATDGFEDGDSGGPIVTARGQLLGVLSIADGSPATSGTFPHIRRALPAWALRRALDSSWEDRQNLKEYERRQARRASGKDDLDRR